MGFISKKRKSIFKNKCKDKEFASEIVEIFEEKLSDFNVTLPGITEQEEDNNLRIRSTDLSTFYNIILYIMCIYNMEQMCTGVYYFLGPVFVMTEWESF